MPRASCTIKAGSDARDLRHKLEAFNVKADPAAVDFAWPHLNSPDRFIRYAARLAIERNPVAEWQAKALAEKQPEAAFTALLALARLGAAETQPAVLKALIAIPFASLTEEQQLEKLRVIEVSIARQGVPTGEIAKQLIADVDPLYPAKTRIRKSRIVPDSARPECAQRGRQDGRAAEGRADPRRAGHLRDGICATSKRDGTSIFAERICRGGTAAVRPSIPPQVVQWFEDAGIQFNNGASFANFMSHAHEEAKFTMSPDEIVALSDVLTAYSGVAILQAESAAPPRKVVKAWTTADLQPLLDQVGKGRNFARGKEIFTEAQCIACHRYGDQGRRDRARPDGGRGALQAAGYFGIDHRALEGRLRTVHEHCDRDGRWPGVHRSDRRRDRRQSRASAESAGA